ncbi:unnamed protein product, partial [Linum tenue]
CRLSYQNGGTWCRFKARDYVVLVAYWTRNHVYPEAYPNHEIGAILSSEPQTSCASWRQDFSCYVSTGIHDMPVICGCFFSTTIAPWKQKDVWLFIPLHSGRKISRSIHCSGSNDQLPKQIQLGYDPSEELLGLPDPKSRLYPNFHGGLAVCSEFRRLKLCNGIMTCGRCSGDRVIWEESIDEQPWEKARSSSAFKVKEDDEVDNLEIKLETKKKSKRVYQSPSPEVGLKISRSLKSLNAKTGLFSNRMKIIHSDPKLSAERAASIKKAKGTAAARKRTSESLKAFFSDPENRQKRSISMQGLMVEDSVMKKGFVVATSETRSRTYICSSCKSKGHNVRTCPNRSTEPTVSDLQANGGS